MPTPDSTEKTFVGVATAKSAPVSPAAPAASTGAASTELVFPLSRFAQTLMGTKNEVWLGILKAFHRTEKHTKSGWHAVIDSYRNRPGR